MARIRTEDGLVQYIKSQLGYPTIDVEVSDQQIAEIIGATVQKFTNHAYGDLEDVVLLQIGNAGEYTIPDSITSIISLSRGGGGSNVLNFNAMFGGGYVPNIWSQQFFVGGGNFMGNMVETIISLSSLRSQLDMFFGNAINYNFDHFGRKLKIMENVNTACALHYTYEYLPDPSNDLIYDQEWVKEYAEARVKYLWGTVTGKYDQVLIGGAKINYADMKSEGKEKMDYLDEQLLTRWQDPCPIMIG